MYDELADPTQVTEVRVHVPVDVVAVVDALAHATGSDRTSVVRNVLREWSEREIHKATLVCRVAGVDPTSSAGNRIAAGKGAKT